MWSVPEHPVFRVHAGRSLSRRLLRLAEQGSIVSAKHTLFIHSSADGRLGCFTLGHLSDAATNLRLRVWGGRVFPFLLGIYRVGLLGQIVTLCFNSCGSAGLFQSGRGILRSCQQRTRSSVSTSSPALVGVCLFDSRQGDGYEVLPY